MQQQARKTFRNGAWLVCLAIVLGAFGRHAIQPHVTPYELGIFETAARYHLANALGLLGLAQAHHNWNLPRFRTITALLYCGMFIFCLSLYLLGSAPTWTRANVNMLGAVTPIGGLCLISGWAMAGFSVHRSLKSVQS